MTDEPRPDTDTATEQASAEQPGGKLRQQVEINDLGACRKRIKVTVERADIDARFGDHFKKLVHDAAVPGFRPGKAPRRLVERRFQREVAEQVKGEVLMASLQQLGEDHDIAPLSEPDLDVDAIEMPAEGPLVYEFEVEVRPQFDLPPYRNLRLRRPVKTFTDEMIADHRRQLLSRYGQIVPKPEGNAQIGDVLVADVTFRYNGQTLTQNREAQIRIERDLVLKDGMARGFGDQVKGANPGDKKVVRVELSSAAANPQLAGQVVDAEFDVKEVKKVVLPELTPEFLSGHFGVQTPGALDEAIRVALNRELDHQQRRAARMQVLEQISSSANWDLPNDLLQRQARKALARRMMEMRADGMTDEQIERQRRILEQDVLKSTAALLKEHFVLQKIAEVEKIDVDEDDLNDEIERMAEQNGESPRRLRARLEREDMLDALAAEMVERKVVDLILDSAEYQDVPLDREEETPTSATAEVQAVPGELRDPVAAPEPTPAAEGGESAATPSEPEASH